MAGSRCSLAPRNCPSWPNNSAPKWPNSECKGADMATNFSNPEAEEDLLTATFHLGDGEGVFGIDATLIQEVVMVGELTPVRHAPEYVAGIRNLRGRIITVIDLCVRLDLGNVEVGPESRIL